MAWEKRKRSTQYQSAISRLKTPSLNAASTLAADPLRMALSREEGDPLERFLIERIACYQKFLDRTQKRSQKSESATREALSINRAS